MSKQRQVVLDVVLNSSDHPSAEMVLARCKEVMPSINLATVYRNLNALVSEGLVIKVVAAGGDRFDKTIKNHAHFQCTACNSVSDVMGVDLLEVANKCNDGFAVKMVDLTIKGLCPNCNNG